MAGRPASAIDQRIAARILTARASAGLGMKDAAAALGVTQQQYAKYEAGLNRISAGALQALAKLFEISVGELFDPVSATPVIDTVAGDPLRLLALTRCEAFNAAHPVGSSILIWLGAAHNGRPVCAEVVQPARLGRRSSEPRVRVRGFGAIALSQVFERVASGERELIIDGRQIEVEEAELRVSPATAHALRSAAAKREISATELVNRLVEAIAADGLVDAVLEDGAQRRARRRYREAA